ncbi:Protein PLANT CADMIUM RESISTANCE 2 [Holothuria leucospilota]|uniref:Protein PLANT CADMIUM RESISTANCE 2 n=1 Tax=Holothuria leucospilota TaxID=206669 RepID=A0A9Q1CBI9_HOLLE|nr:Protein PLANT CADMIUM RESISTANCE 2 [Holothuria leucospilota]
MGEFQNGICGCLGNIGMCIFTYFIPCYTQGKLAESVGDDCLLCGVALLIPLVNIYARVSTRGKVRDNKGIEGGVIGDLICVLCCPLCALMQEAQEMSVSTPLGAGESIARS